MFNPVLLDGTVIVLYNITFICRKNVFFGLGELPESESDPYFQLFFDADCSNSDKRFHLWGLDFSGNCLDRKYFVKSRSHHSEVLPVLENIGSSYEGIYSFINGEWNLRGSGFC